MKKISFFMVLILTLQICQGIFFTKRISEQSVLLYQYRRMALSQAVLSYWVKKYGNEAELNKTLLCNLLLSYDEMVASYLKASKQRFFVYSEGLQEDLAYSKKQVLRLLDSDLLDSKENRPSCGVNPKNISLEPQ